jgi:molybdopterin converting factor small subunit
MRYYTKEWHTLLNSLGTVDLFRPVIDKEYSDEEIEELYQEFEDRYVEEERAAYDEPPVLMIEDDDDFDPEDYVVWETDEDGNEINVHNPADLDELRDFTRMQMQYEIDAYENREPFDEEEAREEFREEYEDALEEPDEDIPQWIRDSVDVRLLAMGALPESAYKKLMKEEEAMQERFDELDEAADDALEDIYEELCELMPDEYPRLLEDLDELDGEYVIGMEKDGDELEMEISGWDDEGDPVKRTVSFEGVQILEDEGVSIDSDVDEDGDVTSNCDLESHELYFEDGRFEVHFLLDDGEYKYLTFTCDDISITQSRFED